MLQPRSNLLRRTAFTLVELLLASMVMSMLLGVCMSIIVVSARARTIDSAANTTSRLVETRAALDQIATELKSATAITSRASDSITFSVPDRNNDGQTESIGYLIYSGDLYRTYNGIFTGKVMLTDVNSLNFNYLDKTGAISTPVESSETLLMSYTGTSNATTDLSTTSFESQYVNPVAVLPANAISWKITRVQLLLKRKAAGSTGNMILAIKAGDATFKPSGAAIATATVAASAIPTSNTWVDITLSPAPGDLSPGTGVTLVTNGSTATANVTINGVLNPSPVVANTAECYSTNSGSTWTTPSNAAIFDFKIYGTYTTLP